MRAFYFLLIVPLLSARAIAELPAFPETTYLRVTGPGIECTSERLGVTTSSGDKADGAFPVCALRAFCKTTIAFKELPAKSGFTLSIACKETKDGCLDLAACAKQFSYESEIAWITGEISKNELTPRTKGVSCSYGDKAPRVLFRRLPGNGKKDSPVEFDEKGAVCMELVSCDKPEKFAGLVVCEPTSGRSMKDKKAPECPTATACFANRFPLRAEKKD